uniref:Uncharacterized protein n=1 Tax=Anas zonorhyncha TaxID=75864 RepID=A0A8B9V2Q0_9AVES
TRPGFKGGAPESRGAAPPSGALPSRLFSAPPPPRSGAALPAASTSERRWERQVGRGGPVPIPVPPPRVAVVPPGRHLPCREGSAPQRRGGGVGGGKERGVDRSASRPAGRPRWQQRREAAQHGRRPEEVPLQEAAQLPMIMLQNMPCDLAFCPRLPLRQIRAVNWDFLKTKASSVTTTHIRAVPTENSAALAAGVAFRRVTLENTMGRGMPGLPRSILHCAVVQFNRLPLVVSFIASSNANTGLIVSLEKELTPLFEELRQVVEVS